MNSLVAIALGSALGGVLRYLAGLGVHAWFARTFPWGTLAVNVLGCLAIGLCWVWLAERGSVSPEWRALVIIGVLGGFTTFSSFSLETLLLVQEGAMGRAAAYVLTSVSLCLAATWAGMTLARHT
ncbi:MAG: fluoride efflux transporter CrcB [Steroidobacteraceae bacterium]|nr:fluoride efflux transporter CrcB [Steroidobacteraceae bacterium]MCC7200880.1 fluoride efflux transporter CrcB [Gammaproteobacteria bacterium]